MPASNLANGKSASNPVGGFARLLDCFAMETKISKKYRYNLVMAGHLRLNAEKWTHPGSHCFWSNIGANKKQLHTVFVNI